MLGGIFEKNKINEKIKTFDKEISKENFWKDKLTAQKILKEKKFLENIFNDYNSVTNELKNVDQLLDLAAKENDVVVIKDCEEKIILILNHGEGELVLSVKIIFYFMIQSIIIF